MSRYLRIAAAVVFALLGMAFVALWVRSYWRLDEITGPIGESDYSIASNLGQVLFGVLHFDSGRQWELRDYPASHFYVTGFGVLRQRSFGPSGLVLPHWFLAASAFALAALLAFRRHWRFSVRGLLIATTVIAATLGLVVYAV